MASFRTAHLMTLFFSLDVQAKEERFTTKNVMMAGGHGGNAGVGGHTGTKHGEKNMFSSYMQVLIS
jgi:hypothetical protein